MEGGDGIVGGMGDTVFGDCGLVRIDIDCSECLEESVFIEAISFFRLLVILR